MSMLDFSEPKFQVIPPFKASHQSTLMHQSISYQVKWRNSLQKPKNQDSWNKFKCSSIKQLRRLMSIRICLSTSWLAMMSLDSKFQSREIMVKLKYLHAIVLNINITSCQLKEELDTLLTLLFKKQLLWLLS